IEAFAALFTVMTDPRDVWMMNARSGAGFAQETRPYAGILRDFPINHFQRDRRIENGIARAIRYCHGTGPELNWKAVRADLHFEMIVFQWSRRYPPRRFGLSWFLAAAQKAQISETT